MIFPLNNAKALSLSWAYFVYFSFLCLEYTYLSSYLITHLKFSGKIVSIIFGGMPLVGLLAQTIWGQLADFSKKTGRIIRYCAFAAFISFLPLCFYQTFTAFLLCLWLVAFCLTSIPALLDTLTLTRFSVKKYGRIRVWGSVGYACAAMAFPAKSLEYIVVSMASCLLLCWFSFLLIGEEQRKGSVEKRTFYLLCILKKPAFIVLALFSVLHWSSNMPYHFILDVHRRTMLLPDYITGIAIGAGIIAEVLFMVTAEKWLVWASPRSWLMIVSAVTGIRWALMSFPLNSYCFVGLQFIHGFSFGVFFVASISYLTTIIPENMRASGQTLFAAFTFGLGSMLGNAYTGPIFDLQGKGYAVFAITAFVSLLSFIAALFIGVVGRRDYEQGT